jgi:hypothetical protein
LYEHGNALQAIQRLDEVVDLRRIKADTVIINGEKDEILDVADINATRWPGASGAKAGSVRWKSSPYCRSERGRIRSPSVGCCGNRSRQVMQALTRRILTTACCVWVATGCSGVDSGGYATVYYGASHDSHPACGDTKFSPGRLYSRYRAAARRA